MAVGDVTGVVMDEEINNAQIVDSGASTVDDAIAEIQSGKSIFQLFGSIKKAFLGCITTSKLANNLATTLEGFALDARQGKVLKDSVDVLNTNLNKLTTYTSDEVETGEVWGDGKKIYRKYYSVSVVDGGSTNIDLTNLGTISKVIKMGGIGNSGGLNVPIPYASETPPQAVSIFMNYPYLTVKSVLNISVTLYTDIFIEYTK